MSLKKDEEKTEASSLPVEQGSGVLDTESAIKIALLRYRDNSSVFILKPELAQTIIPEMEEGLGLSLIVGPREVMLCSKVEIETHGWSLEQEWMDEYLLFSSNSPAGKERILTGLKSCMSVLDTYLRAKLRAKTGHWEIEKTTFLREQFRVLIIGLLEEGYLEKASQKVRERTNELIRHSVFREAQ